MEKKVLLKGLNNQDTDTDAETDVTEIARFYYEDNFIYFFSLSIRHFEPLSCIIINVITWLTQTNTHTHTWKAKESQKKKTKKDTQKQKGRISCKNPMNA